jgi:hypothetical protein
LVIDREDGKSTELPTKRTRKEANIGAIEGFDFWMGRENFTAADLCGLGRHAVKEVSLLWSCWIVLSRAE